MEPPRQCWLHTFFAQGFDSSVVNGEEIPYPYGSTIKCNEQLKHKFSPCPNSRPTVVSLLFHLMGAKPIPPRIPLAHASRAWPCGHAPAHAFPAYTRAWLSHRIHLSLDSAESMDSVESLVSAEVWNWPRVWIRPSLSRLRLNFRVACPHVATSVYRNAFGREYGFGRESGFGMTTTRHDLSIPSQDRGFAKTPNGSTIMTRKVLRDALPWRPIMAFISEN